MSPRRPASPALLGYYLFLLLMTGLSYGDPYPVFGATLHGAVAKTAVVVDCLVLIHIAVGIARAQRLSWYLLLGYNLFELLSLAVILLGMEPGDVARLAGDGVSPGTFYTGVLVATAAMVAATIYASRLRERFADRDPYLF